MAGTAHGPQSPLAGKERPRSRRQRWDSQGTQTSLTLPLNRSGHGCREQ
ncbi:hypothetical protein [Stenomitos frigidus]|nr:hypothetical protein [Stenomitos frigidus]